MRSSTGAFVMLGTFLCGACGEVRTGDSRVDFDGGSNDDMDATTRPLDASSGRDSVGFGAYDAQATGLRDADRLDAADVEQDRRDESRDGAAVDAADGSGSAVDGSPDAGTGDAALEHDGGGVCGTFAATPRCSGVTFRDAETSTPRGFVQNTVAQVFPECHSPHLYTELEYQECANDVVRDYPLYRLWAGDSCECASCISDFARCISTSFCVHTCAPFDGGCWECLCERGCTAALAACQGLPETTYCE